MATKAQTTTANGVTIEVPSGFAAVPVDNGVKIAEQMVRQVRRVTVVRYANRAALKATGVVIPGDKSRDGAAYTITERGSGSGGVEYELLAVRPEGTGFLVMKADEQTEGTPSFDLAWAVFNAAKLAD